MHATRLLLGFMAACVAPVTEGEVAQSIIGGTQATSAQFPTVVGLLEGGDNWFCTGVLVDPSYVLTTASCFEGVGGQVQIRLDDTTLNNSGGRTVAVTAITKHPEWNINSATWNHDIAMLTLGEAVTDRTPSPIHRETVALATSVTQVGFGYGSNNGNGGVLRSLITSSTDCAQANDNGITNTNLMCFDADDGNGSCYGDGGAPALLNGAVAGLGSGGTEQSCTDGLDVYTAISAELGFIDGILPVTPPPTEPTDPEPTEPTTPDDDVPTDPDDDDDDDDPKLTPVRGCSAGGNGGLLGIGLALAFALRSGRSRRRGAVVGDCGGFENSR